MKRPPQRKAEGQHPLAEMDPKAFEKFPLLRGFFFDACFDDDTQEREQGAVILRAESSRWTAVLKEPSSCLQLYLAAPTLGDLWKLSEAALGDDRAQWVKDTWQALRTRGAGRKRT